MTTIKSSFKKVSKPTISNKCHFGHPQFDAIFNGNLSKGHIMIMEQDHPSINYLSLLRCFISSNYNDGIPSLIYDPTPNRWNNLISPPVKKSTKQQKNEPVQKSQIAWRYDKMQIKLNQLMVNQKMSFVDLNKQIPNINETLLSKHEYPKGQLIDFYKQIQQKFIELNENEKDVRPKKILLSSVPSYFYKDKKFWQFFKALRCLTRSSHCFTLLTVPPIISDQIRNKLIFFSDYFIQIGKVGKGYKDFCGSITVLKQIQTCTIKTNYRGVSIWGIKNKKKQFRIQSLYEQAVQEQEKIEKEQENTKIQF